MKSSILILAIFAMTFRSYGQDHPKSLGLNLENESDLAVYMMLYQIGLKDKTQSILGDESCIDVSRDAKGNTNISFGIKTDAFETGTVNFSKDNDQKFKLINGTLTDLFSFFKEANYNPKIAVRSYADPQHNIMRKYATNSSLEKSYGKTLFDKNSNSDPRFDTDSKRRNYLLAYDRGQSFIQKYFPDNLKNKIKATPYNSPNLEVGNTQNNSAEFACPNRRSIVVDMNFNPNLKIQSTPGAFTPAFKVADGVLNHENILAAVFDAKDKDMNELPLFCRNSSTRAFIEISKKRFNDLDKEINRPSTAQAVQMTVDKFLTEERIETDCNRIKRSASIKGGDENFRFEECRKIKRSLKENFINYSNDQSKTNLYNLMANLTVTSDSMRRLAITGLCRSSQSFCNTYRSLVGKVADASEEIWTQKKQRNSSHFLDCFSNELFYQKEFKENPDEYLTPVVDLRDPQSGEVEISYTEENVPKTRRGKGFICQACGNGLKLVDGSFKYSHRAGSKDHLKEHFNDSVKTYENIRENQTAKTMFLMGQQKGLNVYIVKGCKIESLNSLSETSKLVSLQDLKSKKIEVGPNDCIFKPKVINSCVHMPRGNGEGDENQTTYISQVPSMLTGKNLELALESNIDIVNTVFNGLKDDYINTCGIQGENLKKVQDDPENIIESILCKNKGIHIPKPSFDAAQDCPEIASKVLKQ